MKINVTNNSSRNLNTTISYDDNFEQVITGKNKLYMENIAAIEKLEHSGKEATGSVKNQNDLITNIQPNTINDADKNTQLSIL